MGRAHRVPVPVDSVQTEKAIKIFLYSAAVSCHGRYLTYSDEFNNCLAWTSGRPTEGDGEVLEAQLHLIGGQQQDRHGHHRGNERRSSGKQLTLPPHPLNKARVATITRYTTNISFQRRSLIKQHLIVDVCTIKNDT